MKRIVVVLVVALATAGIAFAQQNNSAQGGQPPLGAPPYGYGMMSGGPGQAVQTATIEGKLVFVDDSPALQTKDKTYMIEMPRFYYYAYTDNIREGAQMKLTGVVLPTYPGQDKPFFLVKTAVVGAKTYDFSALRPPMGQPGPRGQGQQRGGGMRGWGPGMMGYGPMYDD